MDQKELDAACDGDLGNKENDGYALI